MEETVIEMNDGGLVISLDFELNWNGHDKGNILGVREVLPKIVVLFEKYEIHATWATQLFLLLEEDKIG